ncbi:MAG: hypothetical protein SPJ32_08790, partial [Oscillospiraceae bacterium]|nr:hypothetical protein [Oscillospiraceae bacterium]
RFGCHSEDLPAAGQRLTAMRLLCRGRIFYALRQAAKRIFYPQNSCKRTPLMLLYRCTFKNTTKIFFGIFPEFPLKLYKKFYE